MAATSSTGPSASRSQQVRVALRRLVGAALMLVPQRLVLAARRRKVLVPLLRHRSIAGLGEVTIDSTPPVTLAAIDSRLVRMLFWYGEQGYEAWEAEWWRRLCRQATAILEVGANIGYYTVHGALAAPGARYTAVEANPESADIVATNLALNRITHVDLRPCAAVGDGGPDTVELTLPALERYVAPTGAFLAQGSEGVAARRAGGRRVVVPTVSASTLVDGVDLIKLDIEGSEHAVLEAGVDTLVASRAVILVEILRDTPRLRELLAGLAEHDYRFWLLAGPQLREVSVEQIRHADLFSELGSRDVAAIPDSRLAAITSG